MCKKAIMMIAVLCLLLVSTAYPAHHKPGEKKVKVEKDFVLEVPGALDFDADTLEGEKLHLSKYLGDVMLVVNVASKCGRKISVASRKPTSATGGGRYLVGAARFPENPLNTYMTRPTI